MSNLFITLLVVLFVLHKIGLVQPLWKMLRNNLRQSRAKPLPDVLPPHLANLVRKIEENQNRTNARKPAAPTPAKATEPKRVPTVQRLTGPLADKRFLGW